MLLYEHISVQILKNLQKCFHTLRSFHRNRINCFLEYSSSDLHSPIWAKRAHPPGGNRHTHPYVYGQARLLYALWRAGGLHGCEISPPQSTIFSLMSLPQPFLPGVDASSCDWLYNSPLSKTPQKSSIQPLSHTRPGWQDLPASLTQACPEMGTAVETFLNSLMWALVTCCLHGGF